MTIFLLQLAIYPEKIRPHHSVVVAEWHYSDVFTSIGKAAETGVSRMREQFELIRKAFGADDWTIDEIGDEVWYSFTVYEFDPEDGRSNDFYPSMDNYAEWRYDWQGALILREETRTEEKDGKKCVYCHVRFPGDDDPDAGDKFAVGQLVTVSKHCHISDFYDTRGEDREKIVYCVAGVPGRKSEWLVRFPHGDIEAWENVYCLDRIDERGLHSHCHPHETQIFPFEGELPVEHPLHLLRRGYLKEIEISDELWREITAGKVQFDLPGTRNWRDIPELYDGLK